MKTEQIVKKCIEKAIEWGLQGWGDNRKINQFNNSDYFSFPVYAGKRTFHINELLFDNSFTMAFAKYLWKSKKYLKFNRLDNYYKYTEPNLKYEPIEKHWRIVESELKIELVLSEDRLEYMKQFIKGGKDE